MILILDADGKADAKEKSQWYPASNGSAQRNDLAHFNCRLASTWKRQSVRHFVPVVFFTAIGKFVTFYVSISLINGLSIN